MKIQIQVTFILLFLLFSCNSYFTKKEIIFPFDKKKEINEEYIKELGISALNGYGYKETQVELRYSGKHFYERDDIWYLTYKDNSTKPESIYFGIKLQLKDDKCIAKWYRHK